MKFTFALKEYACRIRLMLAFIDNEVVSWVTAFTNREVSLKST